MAANGTDERRVIEGVKVSGTKFRPSDWIERLSTSLASFGRDHRLHYGSEVQSCMIQGQACLVAGKGLAERNPELLAYLMKVAVDNQRRIQEERRCMDLPSSVERRAVRRK